MKKLFLIAAVVLMATSCSRTLTTYTSTNLQTKSQLQTATTADLEVAENRISYTMRPTKAVQDGGKDNVINAAVAEALKMNGNADVLVDLEYVLELKDGRVEVITVTGHPAKYRNYRSLNK
jgi:PBP1b-binding outer membrane lipoprotein LpoB